MSTGTLDIWITAPGDPCRIDNETYQVAIAHCDGAVLEWCGEEYVGLDAECGHLEVEVPPGCYQIRAVRNRILIGSGGIYVGNWLTESAIVQVRCGDDHCVTLYTPAAKTCGRLFELALREVGEGFGVDRDLLDATVEHLEAIGRELPATGAVNTRLEQYDRLVEAATEGSADDPERQNRKRGRAERERSEDETGEGDC